jgi:ABC-type branched-subunit amino acid transport system substrate-binding protein
MYKHALRPFTILFALLASLAADANTAALAWFDHVNSKGGVDGRKIVLKTLDDAYDGARSARNTTELLQGDGVFALFVYVGLAATNGALPIVEQSDVPFFAPLTGTPLVHAQFQPNVFNIRASNVTSPSLAARAWPRRLAPTHRA